MWRLNKSYWAQLTPASFVHIFLVMQSVGAVCLSTLGWKGFASQNPFLSFSNVQTNLAASQNQWNTHHGAWNYSCLLCSQYLIQFPERQFGGGSCRELTIFYQSLRGWMRLDAFFRSARGTFSNGITVYLLSRAGRVVLALEASMLSTTSV